MPMQQDTSMIPWAQGAVGKLDRPFLAKPQFRHPELVEGEGSRELAKALRHAQGDLARSRQNRAAVGSSLVSIYKNRIQRIRVAPYSSSGGGLTIVGKVCPQTCQSCRNRPAKGGGLVSTYQRYSLPETRPPPHNPVCQIQRFALLCGVSYPF